MTIWAAFLGLEFGLGFLRRIRKNTALEGLGRDWGAKPLAIGFTMNIRSAKSQGLPERLQQTAEFGV